MGIKEGLQDFIVFQRLQTLKEEIQSTNNRITRQKLQKEFRQLSRRAKKAGLYHSSKIKLVS